MSLSLLELRGLGDQLPANWRLLADRRPDLEAVEPLLFRNVARIGRVPEHFQRHFLVPIEMMVSQDCLVVVRWPSPGSRPVSGEHLHMPIGLLHSFRLFQVVEGQRVPVALPELFPPPEVQREHRLAELRAL